MKKIFVTTLIIVLLVSAGCSNGTDDSVTVQSSPKTTGQKTAQPTKSPVPTPSAVISPTPIPTTTPVSTPTPKGYVCIAEGFCYYELTDSLKQRITGMSYPEEGSDVITYDDLRYIEVLYYDFDGNVKEGELIVNVKVAQEVSKIFYELYEAQYPLESVVLVDDFGEPGDDNLSMAANNTSGFNYRYVTGSSKLSRHSYGAAIDINPKLNPYINGERVAPENGSKYVDRSLKLPGMIDHDDLCYKLFIDNGWTWGGDWSGDKDYQHFSKDLGY